jgi:hypothetical protein
MKVSVLSIVMIFGCVPPMMAETPDGSAQHCACGSKLPPANTAKGDTPFLSNGKLSAQGCGCCRRGMGRCTSSASGESASSISLSGSRLDLCRGPEVNHIALVLNGAIYKLCLLLFPESVALNGWRRDDYGRSLRCRAQFGAA